MFRFSSMTILYKRSLTSITPPPWTKSPLLMKTKGLCSGTETSALLPPLPVPELDKTIQKFLAFAKPIQPANEYAQTVKIAEEFQQNEEAKHLQSLLEKRGINLPNWLTPWWLENAYLDGRTPLPVVTSPGVTFPYFNFSGLNGQIEYAAKIIQAALKFHHRILQNELEVDKSHKKPLDMSQYKLLFGTTRIPRRKRDLIRYGMEQPQWAQHIMVTRNGHIFQMNVYNDDRQILGLDQLQAQLREIHQKSVQSKVECVNIVSSDARDCWAEVYKRLKWDNMNEVESVENSLFLMCLDRDFGGNARPEDQNMAMALHGGGPTLNSRNRWFDKTLQFYVSENGYGGMTYEHTPAEGPPLSRLLDYICDQINADTFVESTEGTFRKPNKLEFKVNADDRQAIHLAEERLQKVVQNLEVKSLAFNEFGKNVPKQAGLSPDSWIQVALQLAYYRIHRTHAPAYETGTLRKFREGRTDTIRLPTMESVHFVETISNRSRPATTSNELLLTLLTSAIQSHKQYSTEVMNGQGIDRHLLGLRLIAEENGRPLPVLLRIAAYKKLMHFQLSTSQVPTKHILPMGFGPSESDCYGVCYNPQEKRIFFTITAFNECKETSAERFANELFQALMDMRDVVDRMDGLKERAKL